MHRSEIEYDIEDMEEQELVHLPDPAKIDRLLAEERDLVNGWVTHTRQAGYILLAVLTILTIAIIGRVVEEFLLAVGDTENARLSFGDRTDARISFYMVMSAVGVFAAAAGLTIWMTAKRFCTALEDSYWMRKRLFGIRFGMHHWDGREND